MIVSILRRGVGKQYADRLRASREQAAAIAGSSAYRDFVDLVRVATPGRFMGGQEPERFLRGVDSHLVNFVPRLLPCVEGGISSVFDFGCGTGSSIVSLAMLFPDAQFRGVDISRADVSIAHERAKLYGVAERCQFEIIEPGQALSAPDGQYDLCTSFSVLEYVTDPCMRKRCVQEMARVITPGGVLFITVPNRLYPFEIHTGKFGWNYFPKLLRARMVGSLAWEIEKLARPHVLKLYRTPLHQLFTPWTNFGLRKAA